MAQPLGSSRADAPHELRPVLELLPAPVGELRQQLAGAGRPWFVQYGGQQAVLRSNDPARFRSFGFSPELARASIDWLHEFLRDLAIAGVVAPAPVPDLRSESVAVVDKKERHTYEKQKSDLLKKHPGQFALIHDTELVGTYTTFAEAYGEGVKGFGLDAFLIQEIREDDPRAQHPALDVGAIITR